MMTRVAASLSAVLLSLALPVGTYAGGPTEGAAPAEPGASAPVIDLKADWPCVQRKVETLSVSQVWDGPAIEGIKGWYQDTEITRLIPVLVSRRIPLAEAEAEIKTFAASIPDDKRDARLVLLFAGLFDKVASDRRSVMSGIEKFQKAQRERAAELERQSTDIAKLEEKAPKLPGQDDPPFPELDQAREKFNWAQRIFQDRQQSMPLACELPVMMEERLYGIAQAIRAQMKG